MKYIVFAPFLFINTINTFARNICKEKLQCFDNYTSDIKKDSFASKIRKINDFAFSFGVEPMNYFIHNSKIDSVQNTYVPLSISLSLSKYFNRRHNIGVGFDYGLNTDKAMPYYLESNLTYKYQYDKYEKNIYPTIILQSTYFQTDRIFYGLKSANISGFPILYNRVSFSGWGISIGHGLNFTIAEKKSISVEAIFNKSFVDKKPLKDKKIYGFLVTDLIESFSILKLRLAVNV